MKEEPQFSDEGVKADLHSLATQAYRYGVWSLSLRCCRVCTKASAKRFPHRPWGLVPCVPRRSAQGLCSALFTAQA